MAEIELAKDLTYEERPSKILDQVERVTRSEVRKFSKFSGSITPSEKQLWSRKSSLRVSIQSGFPKQPNLEDEIHSNWGRFVTAWFLPFLICLKFHLEVFGTWSF